MTKYLLGVIIILVTSANTNVVFSATIDRASWMSSLADNIRLNKLIIPGSHDSGAINLELDAGETQDWDITQQLENGIRFLDVRISNSTNQSYDFEVRHGILLLGNFNKVIFEPVNKFLTSHPKEIVLMSVSDEGSPLDKDKFMKKMVDASSSGTVRFLTNANTDITLGEARGGIVFFNRLGTSGGIQWGNTSAMSIQDNYKLDCKKTFLGFCFKDSIDYQKKANGVIAHLNLAKNNANKDLFFINFASANWNGIYIGNNAEVVNLAVKGYFNSQNQLAEKSSSFGSIIPMDYANRPDEGVITSMLEYNLPKISRSDVQPAPRPAQ